MGVQEPGSYRPELDRGSYRWVRQDVLEPGDAKRREDRRAFRPDMRAGQPGGRDEPGHDRRLAKLDQGGMRTARVRIIGGSIDHERPPQERRLAASAMAVAAEHEGGLAFEDKVPEHFGTEAFEAKAQADIQATARRRGMRDDEQAPR